MRLITCHCKKSDTFHKYKFYIIFSHTSPPLPHQLPENDMVSHNSSCIELASRCNKEIFFTQKKIYTKSVSKLILHLLYRRLLKCTRVEQALVLCKPCSFHTDQPFSRTRTFIIFFSKICKFEHNTTSDWLNRMV